MAAPKSSDRGNNSKTPVTIITGFLGAGKTTLLNYILKEKGSRSIAVIENEFGEVNIDTELVADNLLAKEDLVSLENGCVCCSLRKDIVKAFAEIERRSRQQAKRVDAIVLETTGLADPAPVAFTFFANPWLASRYRLDSIICVVDARYLMQHLEDGQHSDGTVNEAVQQIAFADLILLNKVDLVKDEVAKKQVLSAIKSLNNSARVIECQLNQDTGRPPMDLLLFNNLFSVNRVLEQIDPQFLDSDSDSDTGDDAELSFPHPAQQQQQRTGDLDPGQASHAASTSAAAAEGIIGSSDPATIIGGDGDGNDVGTATAAAVPGAPFVRGEDGAMPGRDAAARSSGLTGTSTDKPMSAAASLLRKYGVHGPHLSGRKHSREPHDCEDNCEECHIVDGMPIKGDRNPKRRAKRLHDLSDVSSVGIMARGPLDEYRFNMYMKDLLSEKAKDIFRCKGVLSVHGLAWDWNWGLRRRPWGSQSMLEGKRRCMGYGNTKFVFQGVHETICYGPAEQPWKPEEPRINQVVFIGRGLDRKALIEGFRTCVWVPLPDGWDEFRDDKTKQPFYMHRQTGEKSWTRPEIACARVVATQGVTQQPSQLLPKRQPSQLSTQPSQPAVSVVPGTVHLTSPAGQSAQQGDTAWVLLLCNATRADAEWLI
ncbi:hypothetical protein VOLCADRAFT_105795 [Volvox carteri f. nagariensis]|uniref:WW domain-containing protein n=1 Tax=Volvox carteri f. nagariensis TaxID=3068 RepID=D8U352_VOLCA|nr:uncharacterized protein VOLCADRAFT_105795 [Volvox carteri f. nagariensis]EFJ45918.1 hypothetical protein VOLCADRAFT_105795 [Volvox carteri f. nagariensis]|eukprot:XP_002952996.1 hypothetical protein VOLCADRAFT_105795 [Volvox carteri f. nagariensis]